MQSSEIEAILVAARKSTEFMSAALRVGVAFPALRDSLIREFADELEKELRKEKDGRVREVDTSEWRNTPTASYTGVSVRWSDWPEQMFIRVDAGRRGIDDYYFGVRCPDGSVQTESGLAFNEAFRKRIADAVNKKLGQGRSSPWFPWWAYCETEFRHFSSVTTLDALIEKTRFIRYLRERIELLEQAVEEVLQAGINPR